MQRQSSYKVHMNTISNGELSDPLCDSVNRGLTLVRLLFIEIECEICISTELGFKSCSDWLADKNKFTS